MEQMDVLPCTLMNFCSGIDKLEEHCLLVVVLCVCVGGGGGGGTFFVIVSLQ